MDGIGIKVGDQFLETKGVSLSVTLRSPVFNKEEGSSIFNFTFPATDKNKKILGFINRPEAFSTDLFDYAAQIYFKGAHLWNGTLRVNYGRTKEFEASIGLEKGNFNYAAKQKKLTELSFDTLKYTLEEKSRPHSILKVTSQKYPAAKFAYFPVYNPGLFSDTFFDQFFNMNIERLKEAVLSQPFSYSWILNSPPFGYFYKLEHDGWIAPYVDVNGDQKTAADYWFSVLDQYAGISDRYNNNPTDFHLRDKVYHFFTYFFESINHWGLFPQMASSLRLWNEFWAAGWVNYIDINFLPHTHTPGKHIVPFPYLCGVIKQAISEIGYAKGTDFFSIDKELSTLCLVTMNCMDTAYGEIHPATTMFNINLNEHLPDVTISEFFKALSDFFNCSIIPKKDYSVDIIKNLDILHTTKVIEFSNDVKFIENSITKSGYKFHINVSNDEWFSSQVKQEGVNLFPRIPDVYSASDLPDAWTQVRKINVVCWVEGQQAFYITTFEDGNLQWKQYSRRDTDLIVDDGYPDITAMDVNCGYLIKHYGWYAGSDSSIFQHMGYSFPFFEFPRCSIKGNGLLHAISFDGEYNPAPIKLMFYRGRKNFAPNPISNADLLPHGSADDSYLGNPIYGLKHSLLWDGENGVFNRFWKDWIYWKNNLAKDEKIKKMLTLPDLMDLDWTAKYSINGLQYFISEIRFDMDEIIHTAEIDLKKA